MRLLQIQAGPEWLALLDELTARDGGTRALLIERLVEAEAARLGFSPVSRLRPSKFNPWPRPAEPGPGRSGRPPGE